MNPAIDLITQCRRVAYSNRQFLENGEYYLTLSQIDSITTGEAEPELIVVYYNQKK